MTSRAAAFLTFLAAQGVALAVAALILWALATAPLDGFVASGLDQMGWYRAAGYRFFFGVAAAAASAGAAWYVTRRASQLLGVGALRTPRYAALAWASVLSVSSLVGSICFALAQPFM